METNNLSNKPEENKDRESLIISASNFANIQRGSRNKPGKVQESLEKRLKFGIQLSLDKVDESDSHNETDRDLIPSKIPLFAHEESAEIRMNPRHFDSKDKTPENSQLMRYEDKQFSAPLDDTTPAEFVTPTQKAINNFSYTMNEKFGEDRVPSSSRANILLEEDPENREYYGIEYLLVKALDDSKKYERVWSSPK